MSKIAMTCIHALIVIGYDVIPQIYTVFNCIVTVKPHSDLLEQKQYSK